MPTVETFVAVKKYQNVSALKQALGYLVQPTFEAKSSAQTRAEESFEVGAYPNFFGFLKLGRAKSLST
jgi:hypothetical protein